MRMGQWVAPLLFVTLASACSRPAPLFSSDNARAHVDRLAGTIGSRAVGTPENAAARQYIVEQLQFYGYTVRVQDVDARRPELGRTAHVANIIAVLPGSDRGAIGVLSHYDSVPEAPGGGDDASGVAVSLEAARVLAARSDRRHTLMILVTDGEEAGLMGAAALTADRDVMDHLQAYVNCESIGASGTAVLFETGPRNSWIVGPWARRSPHPRGASYGIEIYRRLPNDTDFSILKRRDIPGLNFALVDDSYAYHTARDTAERVSTAALRTSGENLVQAILAMDAMDLSIRTSAEPTYFGIGGVAALTYGPLMAWIVALAALACGVLAWFKVLGACVRLVGPGRWLLDLAWTLLGAIVVAGAMVGATWLLREAREVYHPWYAHPTRLFALLLAVGVLAGWSMTRIGQWIPRRAHGPRHPVLAWSVALPVWVVLAGVMASVAPSAGYLWTLPLLVAGAGLLLAPLASAHAVRIVSIVVLAVAGTLWFHDTVDMLRFAVAVFGRLPMITPVAAYATVMLACGVMVVPPFVAAVAATTPVLRPSAVTAVLLVGAVSTAALAYMAPAYTNAQPQRRHARVLVNAGGRDAVYEVGSQEPGLDLDAGAPGGWTRVSDAPQTSVPTGRLDLPFVFRTTAPAPGPAPAAITAFTLTSVQGGTELTMTIVPQAPGLAAMFVLPPNVRPARTNLPGVIAGGRWQATFVAIPPEGVTWRASFRTGQEAPLPATLARVVSRRYPGGTGWQSLPAWLPQDRAVWSMQVTWLLTPPAAIAPVRPLR